MRIGLLGGFSITGPLEPRARSLGKKAAGLLAILAVTPGTMVSRDRLAGLLWSDRDDELARNSLRQTLVTIKRVLGPQIEAELDCGRSAIGLTGRTVRCDVPEFKERIQNGKLSDAIDLYRGPFLDGLFIRDSAFEDWLGAERRRLHELYVEALEVSVEAETGRERVALARRLVASDPLRERAHQLLIEALAEVGARDEALRQFRELQNIYDRELGVSVSADTLAIIRAVERSSARLLPQPNRPEARLPVSPLLAVHPVICLSDSRADAQFATSVSSGLVTTLSKLPYLRVVAMGTAGGGGKQADDLAALDRASAADYMLEGHVASADGRVRVNLHLVKVDTGEYVQSVRHDVDPADGFGAQDEVVLKVAVAINVALLQGDQALSKLNRANRLEPWELVLQASTLISSHDRVCAPAARRSINEALRLDPNYAAAHTLLGWWHWAQAFCGWTATPEASVEEALTAAARGAVLDPENPEPHVVTAIAEMQRKDFRAAEESLARAQDLGPNHAMVYAVAANVANFAGRPNAALRLTEQAMKFCPVYPPWYAGDMAQAHLQLENLTESLAWSKAAIDRSAGYIHAHVFRVIALKELGRIEEAMDAAEIIRKSDPAFAAASWVGGQPFADTAMNDRFLTALLAAGLPERRAPHH